MISTSISLWITKVNKRKSLDEQLDAILKIALQYPYLESSHFTGSWTSAFDTNDEKYLRYDVYCTLLFNYLSRVAEHHKYKKHKVESYIAIKDWIRLHRKYWEDPTSSYENVDSYDHAFVDFVKGYLN
ncbi:hypothetical protein [Mucilaginibacter celer]|uniref:hypothetical protein n=1 Tax=Mucilaginibacter celer TaxID=2305508 RepID=UPI0013CEA326|nr:hypothetical protein [Mucilaginibacter celer]